MTFMPDDSQIVALRTWYLPDNPLHFNPRHPCIKLAGEAGEILDAFGKEEYKPNWSWWQCKSCGRPKQHHNSQGLCNYQPTPKSLADKETTYLPLVLDELGDYSYYLRILAYQKQVRFDELCGQYKSEWFDGVSLLIILSSLIENSSALLSHYVHDKEIVLPFLVACAVGFIAILHKLDTSLEFVLQLNYVKLNSEVTAHGWKEAR